jgi:hypothetical protein
VLRIAKVAVDSLRARRFQRWSGDAPKDEAPLDEAVRLIAVIGRWMGTSRDRYGPAP